VRSRVAYDDGMSELSGRVILVVGATGGLGSRIAAQLEAAGATVVRAARRSGTEQLSIDLRSPDSINSVVDSLDSLDGVVVAAGVVAFGLSDAVADATLQELFEVNALGPIRLIRGLTPLLAQSATAGRSPFIVTISGIVSESPTAGLAAYSASKSAIAAFTTAVTRELRRVGVRVLDARPGHTETALSTHPIAGTAPPFPAGLDPDAVAARIVRALVDDEKDLPSSAF